MYILIMQWNIQKKGLTFTINAFEFVGGKILVLWREYLALAVNGLTKSSKISDLTKRQVF